MKKYACTICGFIYEEAAGHPESGVPAGTLWQALPQGWVCPRCGADVSFFEEVKEAAPSPAAAASTPAFAPTPVETRPEEMQQLSIGQLAALCSNLARGCEKQYLSEEQALFTQLAEYFTAHTPQGEAQNADALLALVEQDLAGGLPAANAAAEDAADRGAKRALVWGEKVTRMLDSLLQRVQKEGDAFLANTNVYVCTICGFIYVGETPPEICPVCKVPAWKFTKVEAR